MPVEYVLGLLLIFYIGVLIKGDDSTKKRMGGVLGVIGFAGIVYSSTQFGNYTLDESKLWFLLLVSIALAILGVVAFFPKNKDKS
ncbi:hypothetical protein [Syntrophomonas wolfei]|uniref:Uncharacterized protein n=1 Tax=Syntrophomonas wolfei TaxID=863 RepID=A0A354YWU6_9FIRM|nr:hypothetical protein [Syntrophomonas wolfei]HBK53186.1 hypothetical protein [Syntrophomonas wolfei]